MARDVGVKDFLKVPVLLSSDEQHVAPQDVAWVRELLEQYSQQRREEGHSGADAPPAFHSIEGLRDGSAHLGVWGHVTISAASKKKPPSAVSNRQPEMMPNRLLLPMAPLHFQVGSLTDTRPSKRAVFIGTHRQPLTEHVTEALNRFYASTIAAARRAAQKYQDSLPDLIVRSEKVGTRRMEKSKKSAVHTNKHAYNHTCTLSSPVLCLFAWLVSVSCPSLTLSTDTRLRL